MGFSEAFTWRHNFVVGACEEIMDGMRGRERRGWVVRGVVQRERGDPTMGETFFRRCGKSRNGKGVLVWCDTSWGKGKGVV